MNVRPKRRKVTRWLVAVGLVGGAAGIASAQSLVDPRLRVDRVAGGLSTTFDDLVNAAVFLNSRTLLVARRSDGQVRRVDLVAGSVATLGPVVYDLPIIAPDTNDAQSEFGVQGLALHPDFATNGWIYVRYDRSLAPPADTPQASVINFVTPMDNVTERLVFDPQANGGVGGLVPGAAIRTARVQTQTHHGGPHLFGPDRRLYTLFGNQRLVNDVSLNGAAQTYSFQDVGTISRLNDDGSVPADNPFGPGSGALNPGATSSWWAYGFRNSFGGAFDPVTGDLWVTDNGEFNFDEINRVPRGANGGSLPVVGPLGDPRQTGNASQLVMLPGAVYVDPAYSWWKTCGVTGLAFLHGSALGEALDDRVIVGNYNTGFLWMLRLNESRTGFAFDTPSLQAQPVDDRSTTFQSPIGTPVQEVLLGTGFGGIYAGALQVLRSPDGYPYVLTARGDLFRISRSCLADIAGPGLGAGPDGLLTIDDFLLFLNVFADESDCPRAPGTGPCSAADLCGAGATFADGVVDVGPDGELSLEDFLIFLNAWAEGCP